MTNNLYLINETITNGYSTMVLDFFSLVSILCAISVIISKNPIVSVLFLIGLFLSIASYLIIIGISFIGLSYLLVYVGAVSILFLFILMLINVRISELLSETKNSIPLVFIIALCFNTTLSKLLPSNLYLYNTNYVLYKNYTDYLSDFFDYSNNKDEISFVTINSWDSSITELNHITSIGNIMYTSYSMWLLLTSIILLLAMVGAIVITIKQK